MEAIGGRTGLRTSRPCTSAALLPQLSEHRARWHYGHMRESAIASRQPRPSMLPGLPYLSGCRAAARPATRGDAVTVAGSPLALPFLLFFGNSWQKALPLALIFTASTFCYTILQSLKDGIVVINVGAEALPWLASCGVFPSSLVVFSIYNRMVQSLPDHQLYYAAVLPFTLFYVVFAALLFPLAPLLQDVPLLEALAAVLPAGMSGLGLALQNWVYSLFFIAADLFGGVVVSVSFWTLADEVCNVSEACDIYPKLGILANLGLMCSGPFIKLVNGPLSEGNTLTALRIMVAAITALTLLCFIAKHHLDGMQAAGPPGEKGESRAAAKSAKPKDEGSRRGGLGYALEVMRGNAKVSSLATWVIAFGVSYKLFEYTWKDQLRTHFPTTLAYTAFLADLSAWAGATTIIAMLVSKTLFQHCGWGGAASISPLLLLVIGSAFFACALANSGWALPLPAAALTALSTVGLAAGATMQVFATACRHSLFSPAKEMVYISMAHRDMKEGKAVVDLIGNQLAKSGAAWMVNALLLAFTSISAALPLISALYVAMVSAWFAATLRLSALMATTQGNRLATTTVDFAAAVRARAAAAATTPTAAAAATAAASSASVSRTCAPAALREFVASASSSSSSSSSASAASGDELLDRGEQSPEYWDEMFRQLADNPQALEYVLSHSNVDLEDVAEQAAEAKECLKTRFD